MRKCSHNGCLKDATKTIYTESGSPSPHRTTDVYSRYACDEHLAVLQEELRGKIKDDYFAGIVSSILLDRPFDIKPISTSFLSI